MKDILQWLKENENSILYIAVTVLWGIDVIVSFVARSDLTIPFVLLYFCYVVQTINIISLINNK